MINTMDATYMPGRGPTSPSVRREACHADPNIPNYRNDDEPAAPSRLQRPGRWKGIEEVSRLALISVLDHGGHERPIVTRGGKHLRSRMGSRKTGLQQVGEGRGHRDLIMLNEVHPDVVDYQAHPFKLEFQLAGERQVYFPDHIRLLRDGTIELIEVKRTPADLADAAYRAKLGGVAEIARRIGWAFRVLYHNDIEGPPARKANVETIYMSRFLRLTRMEQFAVSEFIGAEQSASWSELRMAVCPEDNRRGEAVLRCCVALGRISVNLDEPITGRSIVTPRAAKARTGSIRI